MFFGALRGVLRRGQTGDRQRISGKGRRKFMSVPGLRVCIMMPVGLRRVCASIGNVVPCVELCTREFGPVGRLAACRVGGVSEERRDSTGGTAGRNEA